MAFSKPDVNNIWAGTGSVIEPATAKVAQGWVAEIPDFEFENWIQNRQDQFNAHVNQYGIPEWDSVTEYIANKSYVQDSAGVVYRALTTNTNKNPTTNPSDWQPAFDSFDSSYSKSEADNRFLNESNNLSDLVNVATARTNLSVYSKTEADDRYLLEANNLSDLTNAATARTNLGVYSTSEVYSKTEADGRYLLESNNLSDLTNDATARTNLSVYSKAEADDRYLNESSNLADLVNVATARTNLGVYSQAESDGRYVNTAGDTMTGKLTLDGDPTSALHAATKQYTDNAKAPVSSVIPLASQSVPSGYLKCNGAAVSRSTYSDLFAAIGTTYGAGNGSTTFNLPDLRGEFIRGWDDGRGIDSGRVFGSFQSDAFESHNHGGTALAAGAHSHEYQRSNYANTNNGPASLGADGPLTTYNTSSEGLHTHSLSISFAGSANETRPRNIAMMYCIKF